MQQEEKEGYQLTLTAPHAHQVWVNLYNPGKKKPYKRIEMQKSGPLWSTQLNGFSFPLEYTFSVDHHEIYDPYAKELSTPNEWGVGNKKPHAILQSQSPFDWKGVQKPGLAKEKLLIYEMHVRAFTADPSSQVQNPGTFLGIIEKIPYLKELGINAIELMPIYEFDETDCPLEDPATKKKLTNFWGYSPNSFFSIMRRYGTVQEFQMMVRKLHQAGIEVILDVVYNHTGGALKKIFEILGKRDYFIVDHRGSHTNYSGCGNTLSANSPYLQKMILDSLDYFANELQVDGFRFDLASIFVRGAHGEVLEDAPILRAMAEDPKFANVKLIAEAWDAAGLYHVGSFPGHGRFSEWNGSFRDEVRRYFNKGGRNVGSFSGALCGSEHLYGPSRPPTDSINFITAHDGFTLHDLVSYNDKHNENNGEENRDGCNHNESWNCGAEGETENPEVNLLRKKQVKNHLLSLFTAVGVPMLLMGDEIGLTHKGNNNTWCQDNALNYFPWDQQDRDLFSFCKKLIALRKKVPLMHPHRFYTEKDVQWHAIYPGAPDWSGEKQHIAYTLGSHYYIGYNSSSERTIFELPPPPSHKHWVRIIDTALPTDNMGHAASIKTNNYAVEPHSSIVLKAS